MTDLEKGFYKVFKWDRRKTICDYKKIFIPYNTNIHWICYEIDMEKLIIHQYDSLSRSPKSIIKKLKQYIGVKKEIYQLSQDPETNKNLIEDLINTYSSQTNLNIANNNLENFTNLQQKCSYLPFFFFIFYF